MIPRDPHGRRFRKSIVNDYVRNKKLPRDISAFLFVGRIVRWDITLLIQNIAETYQELTSVKFVVPFLLYVFSRFVERPIIFMKPLGSCACVWTT